MSDFPDSVAAGLARGWRVTDAAASDLPQHFECDVAIVGSGAGGAISAAVLAASGLRVVIIEEGPLRSSRDFNMLEAQAYPQLYQESAARKTSDKAINILQGRCVGGSTTVNWTSSFRTPPATLEYWQRHYGLSSFGVDELAPWFEQLERYLSVGPWMMPANANNDILLRGGQRLGIAIGAVPRNVRRCLDLGYCGMGCPANGKTAMLDTAIPAALERGAALLTRARATGLVMNSSRARSLEIDWLDETGLRPSGRRSTVSARHFVLSGGAINTPALLLRSKAPDPHGLTGRRTFLHPTVVSAAAFPQRVDGHQGAPQVYYSDHFLERDPIDGPVGYKLEVPPLHPVLTATTLQGFGREHAGRMSNFAHTNALIALLRDGFHPECPGGTVRLHDDGSPVLDYPLTDFLFEGARRALLSMAEIQFAAGAHTVYPIHEMALGYSSWSLAKAAIMALPMKPHLTRVVSAHVMGGCPLSADERTGLVGPDARHRHLENVSIHDASLFPTSLGTNPQLTIFALCARASATLAQQLTGRAPEPLA